MEIICSRLINNNALVKIDGEIDESNAQQLKNKLDEIIDSSDFIDIILDLKNLTFMDSTGIGVLLGRYKKSRIKNINIKIKNPSKHVDFIFNTCGVYSIMEKI